MSLEKKLGEAVYLLTVATNLLGEIQAEIFLQQTANNAEEEERQALHDKNYSDLTLFLNKRKHQLEGDLFKAVLWAMDGIMVYKKERKAALKSASIMHKVPEDEINYWLNEMGFRKPRTTKLETMA